MADELRSADRDHDVDQVAVALRHAATRAAELLRAVPNPTAAVPGLTWNVSETAAHMVGELRDYRSCVLGERHDESLSADTETPTERTAAANTRQLDRFGERDLSRLADMLPHAADDFLSASTDLSPNVRIPTPTGLSMTIATMVPTLLGELVVHGLDIARASGMRWKIGRSDALLVLEGILALVPDYVDRRHAAGRDVSYELRFRGGPRSRLEIRDGKASADGSNGKVDCWISADPVAFLLVGYGRTGQWGQIARGRIVAGGRKPWLGFEFSRLITSP